MKKAFFLVVLTALVITLFYLYGGHYNAPQLNSSEALAQAETPECASCPKAGKKPFYSVPIPKELEEANQFTFTLDGRVYTKEQLVSDFFQAAFPRYLWHEDYFLKDGFFYTFPIPFLQDRGRPSKYKEAVLRTKGMPRFEAFSRWKPPARIPVVVYADVRNELFTQDIKEIISEISGKISALTGLELFYSDQLDVETEDPRIYVSFDRYMFSQESPYKSRRFESPFDGEPIRRGDLEPSEARQVMLSRLHGAIRFTPKSRYQVDGLIIPDAENHIMRAECDIWPLHPKNILKALMQECLVRSLGLVETARFGDGAIISAWNTKAVPSPPIGANEYSLAMLSMLYCGDIHPGMGRYDMLDQFYRSNSCFDFTKIQKSSDKSNYIDASSSTYKTPPRPTGRQLDDLIDACRDKASQPLGGDVTFSFSPNYDRVAIEQAPYAEDARYVYNSYVDVHPKEAWKKSSRKRFLCFAAFSSGGGDEDWTSLKVEFIKRR